MINKIFKIIHKKYFRFIKFFFFLRYVLAIFLIGISLFLIVPKFFDYEKKRVFIKEFLLSYYDIELKDYSSIEFNIFPLPNLLIKNTNLKVVNNPIVFDTQNLNIFINFKNIYNYENFQAKKISLKGNEVNLDIDQTNKIFSYFNKLKYDLDLEDLNLNLKKKQNSVLEIKKINFSNYGYKKNRIRGEIFNKQFKSYFKDNKNFNFEILNTGIKADLNFDKMTKNNSISGSARINILDNYLRFIFDLNENRLKMKNSNLKNKDILIAFESLILFDPFFEISSEINLKKINKELIFSLSLDKILKNQEILKKLNSNSKINFEKKGFGNALVKKHSSTLNLAHGRLNFLSRIDILGGNINCKGESLLIEEYPRLYFSCLVKLDNTKKFLKKFSISHKTDKNSLNLTFEGSLNLLNKKINFKKISYNQNYISNEQEMKYFKDIFEKILFNDGFFKIFNTLKIKEFLLEVI